MKLFFNNYPVTAVFIILSCLISVIIGFGTIQTSLFWFIFDQQLILNGQIWRLVTPIFLHFPVIGIIFAHLAFNMVWLWQFGAKVERYDSSRFLLWFIITAGVFSNVIQSLFSAGIFGGMSGVVYALLGYLFIRTHLDSRYLGRVPDNISYFLIGFMLLSGVGLLGDNIADAAHFSGFVFGAIVGYLSSRRWSIKRQ